jgi:NAD(P)-dependent dehydrogenase (short-subunit alcohol dehydrogenase family)
VRCPVVLFPKTTVNPETSMTALNLHGKRILITQSETFMGPALCDVLAELGAEVIADARPLTDPDLPEAIVRAAGHIDVLVANLAIPAPSTPAIQVSDDEWRNAFAHMVDPLPRLVRAALPQMMQRKSGKILLMGSASALRGMKRTSTYSAARGAQIAYIQSVGVEAAAHNVQVNAIAQNFVENPTYFPPEVQANPAFQERLKREVPLGRLVGEREDAMFAAYLCSDAANCFVGQVFPVCGGWVAR